MQSSTTMLSHSKRDFFSPVEEIPSLKQMVLPVPVKIFQYPYKSFSKFTPPVKFRSDFMRLAQLCGVCDKFPRIFPVPRLWRAAALIASLRDSFYLMNPVCFLSCKGPGKPMCLPPHCRLRGSCEPAYPSSLMNKIVDNYFTVRLPTAAIP